MAGEDLVPLHHLKRKNPHRDNIKSGAF